MPTINSYIWFSTCMIFFSNIVAALISLVYINVIVTIEPSKIISEKISYKWGVPSHFRNACVLAKHPDTPTHENMFCATRPQDWCARSHNLWGGGAVVACTGHVCGGGAEKQGNGGTMYDGR